MAGIFVRCMFQCNFVGDAFVGKEICEKENANNFYMYFVLHRNFTDSVHSGIFPSLHIKSNLQKGAIICNILYQTN